MFISLAQAISYGFAHGLVVLKYMTNNQNNFGEKEYQEQQTNYHNNVLKISRNIWVAFLCNEHELSEQPDFERDIHQEENLLETDLLTKRLNEIYQKITQWKGAGKSCELLYVSGFSTEDIRNQVLGGFGV